MGWNGIELSYSTRHTAEQYRERIREEDIDFISRIVQEIAKNTDSEIKEKEDNRAFFADLVLDVAKRADTIIKTKHTERNVVPYTVNMMGSMLLGAVEGHFLQRDNGEQAMADNLGLQEDSEPEPSLIDSWANGSVPVKRLKQVVLKTEKPVLECKVERILKKWEIEFREKYLSNEDPLGIKAKELTCTAELQVPTETEKKEKVCQKKTSVIRRLFGKRKSFKSDSQGERQSRFTRLLSAVLPCVPRQK